MTITITITITILFPLKNPGQIKYSDETHKGFVKKKKHIKGYETCDIHESVSIRFGNLHNNSIHNSILTFSQNNVCTGYFLLADKLRRPRSYIIPHF